MGTQDEEVPLYKLKVVEFFGRRVPIVMQNENGPCPLLAIANVLLLRNQIRIRPDLPEIDGPSLITLVANRLLEVVNLNTEGKDEVYLENQQRNLEDVLPLLPLLQKGINVNVRFRRIDDFEFTTQCIIFDLLDISLVHGWLIDPQDTVTSSVIGGKSYNDLVEHLVALHARALEMDALANPNAQALAAAQLPEQSTGGTVPHALGLGGTEEGISQGSGSGAGSEEGAAVTRRSRPSQEEEALFQKALLLSIEDQGVQKPAETNREGRREGKQEAVEDEEEEVEMEKQGELEEGLLRKEEGVLRKEEQEETGVHRTLHESKAMGPTVLSEQHVSDALAAGHIQHSVQVAYNDSADVVGQGWGVVEVESLVVSSRDPVLAASGSTGEPPMRPSHVVEGSSAKTPRFTRLVAECEEEGKDSGSGSSLITGGDNNEDDDDDQRQDQELEFSFPEHDEFSHGDGKDGRVQQQAKEDNVEPTVPSLKHWLSTSARSAESQHSRGPPAQHPGTPAHNIAGLADVLDRWVDPPASSQSQDKVGVDVDLVAADVARIWGGHCADEDDESQPQKPQPSPAAAPASPPLVEMGPRSGLGPTLGQFGIRPDLEKLPNLDNWQPGPNRRDFVSLPPATEAFPVPVPIHVMPTVGASTTSGVPIPSSPTRPPLHPRSRPPSPKGGSRIPPADRPPNPSPPAPPPEPAAEAVRSHTQPAEVDAGTASVAGELSTPQGGESLIGPSRVAKGDGSTPADVSADVDSYPPVGLPEAEGGVPGTHVPTTAEQMPHGGPVDSTGGGLTKGQIDDSSRPALMVPDEGGGAVLPSSTSGGGGSDEGPSVQGVPSDSGHEGQSGLTLDTKEAQASQGVLASDVGESQGSGSGSTPVVVEGQGGQEELTAEQGGSQSGKELTTEGGESQGDQRGLTGQVGADGTSMVADSALDSSSREGIGRGSTREDERQPGPGEAKKASGGIGASLDDLEVAVAEGRVIENFLSSTAGQLTYCGLFMLQEQLKENQLCVFFRNNHFNTMFKFKGSLYLLATDQGYLNQPSLVWEKLSAVDGDTQFYTGSFQPFRTDVWRDRNSLADYIPVDPLDPGADTYDADLQLALRLHQQELSAVERSGGGGGGSGGGAGGGRGGTPQSSPRQQGWSDPADKPSSSASGGVSSSLSQPSRTGASYFKKSNATWFADTASGEGSKPDKKKKEKECALM